MKATVTQKADGSLELVEVNPYENLIHPHLGHRVVKGISWEKFELTKKTYHTEDKDLIVGSVVDLDDYDTVWQWHNALESSWHDDASPEVSRKYNLDTRQTARKKAVALSDKISHLNCDPEALKNPAFVEAINQMAERAYLIGSEKASPKTDYSCTQCGSETAIDPDDICEACEDKQILAEAKRNAGQELDYEIPNEPFDLLKESIKLKADYDALIKPEYIGKVLMASGEWVAENAVAEIPAKIIHPHHISSYLSLSETAKIEIIKSIDLWADELNSMKPFDRDKEFMNVLSKSPFQAEFIALLPRPIAVEGKEVIKEVPFPISDIDQELFNYLHTELGALPLATDLEAIRRICGEGKETEQSEAIIKLAKSCLFLGRRAYLNITSDEDCWKDFMSHPDNVKLLNDALK